MGTNYYTMRDKHIGKKSAAGYYCWDCNITLCKGGNKEVHRGCGNADHGHKIACDCNWYKECPKCGKKPIRESFENSAVGRELGFNKQSYKRKQGVASCSSFSWAINPLELPRKIKDEYDRIFTLKEFKQILKECPIQYFHSVGEEFS